MLLKELIEITDLLEDGSANGGAVAELFSGYGIPPVEITRLSGEKGGTDVVRIMIPGTDGEHKGGECPTLGVLGTLGGIGARPGVKGLVSDADGAIIALAAALKLARMAQRGDRVRADVQVATHICPDAPPIPHKPVPMMGSPVGLFEQIMAEVSPSMSAILSVDATKGNRILNRSGFAISPTVMQGYILRTSDDLLQIMEWVTGDYPVVLPITTQDITPYGNDIYHINSIMQPAVMVDVPVVGVATTARTAVPGCATGANHPLSLEGAARFCVEVAKQFGGESCAFYDQDEFARLRRLYGPMDRLLQRSEV